MQNSLTWLRQDLEHRVHEKKTAYVVDIKLPRTDLGGGSSEPKRGNLWQHRQQHGGTNNILDGTII